MADAKGAAECVLVAKDVEVSDKTGGVLTSVVHLLTTMIGMGVLAMPNAMSNLGWIAGSIVILLIYGISILAATLLTYCYEVDGVQHPRYFEAVGHILGKRMQTAAAWCQLLDFFLVNTAFTITAATSMSTIASLACDEDPQTVDTTEESGCFNSRWAFSLIFGGAMVLIVQVSNLRNSAWLSMVGAATAMVYPTIALGLCIARVASGHAYGTVGGNSDPTAAAKAFNVLNALGTMSFAFTFSVVLLEVQDTIKEPPKSQGTMKKASDIALSITCLFYVLLAMFGYLALGSETPGNVLTGFENPKWLLILASTLVIINMVASYNIQAQISFLTIEGYLANLMGVRHPAEETALQAAAAVVASACSAGMQSAMKCPQSFTSRGGSHTSSRGLPSHTAKGGEGLPAIVEEGKGSDGEAPTSMWRYSACTMGIRAGYVVLTTILAIVMPFFSQIAGLIGGLVFWPLTIYFPFLMYMKAYKTTKKFRVVLYSIMVFMLLLAMGAVIGSFRNIITSWSDFCFAC